MQDASPALLTVAVSPVVVHAVPHLLVDGRHGFHVALPPLPPQVLGLDLQQLEDVELHHGLLHLQRSLQYRGRLEDYQHLPRKRLKVEATSSGKQSKRCLCSTGSYTSYKPRADGIGVVTISQNCCRDMEDCKKKNSVFRRKSISPSYHRPRVFPLGQLVEDPQQVDAGE